MTLQALAGYPSPLPPWAVGTSLCSHSLALGFYPHLDPHQL